MKKISRMVALAVCGALFAVSCTDTWDDHYTDAAQTGSTGSTTMAYLQTHASDFADIVKAAGYEEKLSSSQMFTILAPQNSSFDKDALLKMIADGNKKEVVERFLENHIMLYPVSLNNDRKTVMLLNEKKVDFGTLEEKTIEGVRVLQENVICDNGIIQVLESEIKFKPNVLEQLQLNYQNYLKAKGIDDDDNMVSIYSFLRKYDADSLDEAHSVEFGQDEFGNIVYSDSVMIRNNTILRSLRAYLYREDSTYWAIDPGVENYRRLYTEALGYFKFNDAYAEDLVRRDSMQRYFAQLHIIGEFFFNANTNEGDAVKETTKGDSLITTTYNRSNTTWRYHNYKAPFSSGILSDITEKQECSNGYVFTWPESESSDTSGDETESVETGEVASNLPISVYDAFFQPIKIETNLSSMVPSVDGRSTTQQWTVTTTSTQLNNGTSNDSVSNGYLLIQATSPANTPIISFKLGNTLSGTYDIYVKMLPWSVFHSEYDDDGNLITSGMLPVKFKSWLYEADGSNVIPYLTNNENVTNFTEDRDAYVDCIHPTMCDTVYVGTHTFKYCYQHTGASSSYLQLSLRRTSQERQQNLYDNKYLIDFIYLVPHRDDVDPRERYQDRFKKIAEDAANSSGDEGEEEPDESEGSGEL